jgi:AbiV family abortive infection protein
MGNVKIANMTENQIKLGIPKIIDNAESLYSDACILDKNGRKERAYTLFQLSLEEIGKALMLVGILMFEDIENDEVQNKIKNNFKNHERKSNISIGLDSFLWEFIKTKNPEKYEKMVFESFKEHDSVKFINERKNKSLYVSFNGNKYFSPSESISIEDVKKIKTKAGFRVFLGKELFRAIIKNIDDIKLKISESGYDSNKTSKEQQKEYRRIMDKYK